METPRYLSRLRAIATELFDYAYGIQDARGERYPAWEEISQALGALERAITAIEALDDEGDDDAC